MLDYESRTEGSLNVIHSLQTGTGSWPLPCPLYHHPDSKRQQRELMRVQSKGILDRGHSTGKDTLPPQEGTWTEVTGAGDM